MQPKHAFVVVEKPGDREMFSTADEVEAIEMAASLARLARADRYPRALQHAYTVEPFKGKVA